MDASFKIHTANKALRLIADIAEGSSTKNSLPHIAKIARRALKEMKREAKPVKNSG